MQYILKNPIKRVSGETLTSLEIREQHTLGDWLWIESNIKDMNQLERSAMAICRFAGLARAEVESLSMVDYYGITAAGAEQDAKKDSSAAS